MIKLKNKGRAPVVVELTSLGLQRQTDIRVGRDHKTGAEGHMEVKRAFPRSVTIPGRGESGELPDEVRDDPALRAHKGVLEVVDTKAAAQPKES